jgi:Tfp pilus assembly protein PilV
MKSRSGIPLRRRASCARSGISLIEVVVACTLLAVTLTSLTGLSARMASRMRFAAVIEQRTATYFQEVNRASSMPYDSLSTVLTKDSVQTGNIYYVWTYTVGAEQTSPIGTSVYRDITLTVTPQVAGATATTGTIRRAKPPVVNALFTP